MTLSTNDVVSTTKEKMKKINLAALSIEVSLFLYFDAQNWEEMTDQYKARIQAILKSLPSGNGLDFGIKFNLSHSTQDKLIFQFRFKHSDDEITSHSMTVTPKFGGYYIYISGPDKNYVKDHLTNIFATAFE